MTPDQHTESKAAVPPGVRDPCLCDGKHINGFETPSSRPRPGVRDSLGLFETSCSKPTLVFESSRPSLFETPPTPSSKTLLGVRDLLCLFETSSGRQPWIPFADQVITGLETFPKRSRTEAWPMRSRTAALDSVC